MAEWKQGKVGEALAKAIPAFADAVGEMKETAKMQRDTVQSARLAMKLL